MSEEEDTGVGLVVMEEEQMRDEGEVIEALGQSSPVRNQPTIIMTGDEFSNGSIPVREVQEDGPGLMDTSSSLLGSFQSWHSSQSSEKD